MNASLGSIAPLTRQRQVSQIGHAAVLAADHVVHLAARKQLGFWTRSHTRCRVVSEGRNPTKA
jgi:hypothetical protein